MHDFTLLGRVYFGIGAVGFMVVACMTSTSFVRTIFTTFSVFGFLIGGFCAFVVVREHNLTLVTSGNLIGSLGPKTALEVLIDPDFLTYLVMAGVPMALGAIVLKKGSC